MSSTSLLGRDVDWTLDNDGGGGGDHHHHDDEGRKTQRSRERVGSSQRWRSKL